MENNQVIYQVRKDPPTFVQDHLTFRLLPVESDGVPYFAERNDNTTPTDEDHARVQSNIKFLFTPHYGPEQ